MAASHKRGHDSNGATASKMDDSVAAHCDAVIAAAYDCCCVADNNAAAAGVVAGSFASDGRRLVGGCAVVVGGDVDDVGGLDWMRLDRMC